MAAEETFSLTFSSYFFQSSKVGSSLLLEVFRTKSHPICHRRDAESGARMLEERLYLCFLPPSLNGTYWMEMLSAGKIQPKDKGFVLI